MIRLTVPGALEVRATSVARVWAYLCRAIWPMLVLSRLTLAQEFRVQIVPSTLHSSASRPTARQPLSRLVTVDLDAYVEGALAGEASVLKNGAALQAMAILVRTWAWRYQGRHHAQGFDFCSLTHCQVFRLPSDSHGVYHRRLWTRSPVRGTTCCGTTTSLPIRISQPIAEASRSRLLISGRTATFHTFPASLTHIVPRAVIPTGSGRFFLTVSRPSCAMS